MLNMMNNVMGDISEKTAGGAWHCPMMGSLTTMGGSWMWLGGILWLVIWVLVIAVLIALVRWLWKKGGK